MYRDRIRRLEKILEDQDKKISSMTDKNQKEYDDLINERQVILNELSNFRKLQWEEDHERVEFDDER